MFKVDASLTFYEFLKSKNLYCMFFEGPISLVKETKYILSYKLYIYVRRDYGKT